MTAATHLGPIPDKYVTRFPTRRQSQARPPNSVVFFMFIKPETFLAWFQFNWSFKLVVNVRNGKRNQNENIHLQAMGKMKTDSVSWSLWVIEGIFNAT